MNTTENEVVNPAPLKDKVSKDDAKTMRERYVKGETIDDLAVQFNYAPALVADSVVAEVPAPAENKTQAEIDAEEAKPAKKGK